MFHNKRIVVVMPAYNAAQTLERTYARDPARPRRRGHRRRRRQPRRDRARSRARLGLRTLVHEKNRGYGGNQKTCYREALRRGADIVVMVHPDYQYTPKLLPGDGRR